MFVKQIAERMIEYHGDRAHLVALINLHHDFNLFEGERKVEVNWREVLDHINELQGESK